MNEHHGFDLVIPVSVIDHRLGPVHAPVSVVEYGDFECPNCKQAAPAVKLVLNQFSDQVRLIFRHFPLEEVHPHSLHAALASEAAGAQGRFWQMHDMLFENQRHLKVRQLRNYAEKLELDMERYESDMNNDLYLQRIREQIAGGERSGVRATPTFFINGALQDVSFGLQSLVDGVEAALHR
jgi:protein-disulfide isomerase